MSLSDLACRTAKPQNKPYKIFDGGGLYLEVAPSGSKHWRLKYRYMGTEKKLSLGPYPTTTLLEAREAKENAKKQLREFIDPALSKKEDQQNAKLKAGQTFEKVAREWHSYSYTNWSERHADNILYRLEKEIFPEIGNYPITKITPPLIHACAQKIEARGAHEMARRSLQLCGQVFRYAVVKGYALSDVTRDIKGTLKKFNRGHYAAIDIDELPELLEKIHRNEARLFRQTILAILLMLLTFVRTREMIFSTWEEFNIEKAEWHIPAERMKMRKPHIVPLSKQALNILKELKEKNPQSRFVFPSIPRPNQAMSNATVLGALKSMGYNGKMTGHGFRALAMSGIKEKLNYPHDVVDRQLAHAPKSMVDRAYDRAKYLPQRKKMMQDWADYIDTLKCYA